MRIFALVSVLSVLGVHASLAQDAPAAASMSFFITSAGPGNGAALDGLMGADAHCQKLAEAAGAGERTWRAYLSASASADGAAVNARDPDREGPLAQHLGSGGRQRRRRIYMATTTTLAKRRRSMRTARWSRVGGIVPTCTTS